MELKQINQDVINLAIFSFNLRAVTKYGTYYLGITTDLYRLCPFSVAQKYLD